MKSVILCLTLWMFLGIVSYAQNVGIGETSPANKLSVKGSLSIGSGYSTTAAPANGLIVQGNVGIGIASSISTLQTAGTLTVGTASSAGSVGMVQLTIGGTSPISNRLTYGTDGTGWKFAISKNQGGTLTDQVVVADNGSVQVNNLTSSGYSPVFASAAGVLTVTNGLGPAAGLTKVPFSTTGVTSWVVPSNVTQILIKIWGAGGACGSGCAGPGGAGGFVSGVLPVTAGSTIYILVGAGGTAARPGAQVAGGGGLGTGTSNNGGGGGGRSAIMSAASNSDLVTAGGGGGGAHNSYTYGGGGGGGLVGGTNSSGGTPGVGGTQTTAGTATSPGTNGAANGGQYFGGNAATTTWGGGGGGGYYGGGPGGGSNNEGPGGGGSSYISKLNFLYSVRNEQGAWNNNINTAAAANTTYLPGGYYDTDYVSGVGTGAPGSTNTSGGNGYVVIYY